jgi:hypothetical protein
MNDLLLARWQRRALVIGAVAAALSIIGAFVNRAQFFHSYLFAWLFWLGLSLGALVVVMMQNLTGGWWGLAVRNLCFAAIMTLPLLFLLFVPLIFGLHQIYAWSNGVLIGLHKREYLSVPFFIARSVFYFAVPLARIPDRPERGRTHQLRALHELRLDGLGHVPRCGVVFDRVCHRFYGRPVYRRTRASDRVTLRVRRH